MSKYIQGNVKRLIFESNNGPYKVGIFRVNETNIEELNEYENKIISFTGSFTELNTELDYIFYGELVNNPKYGVQFSVSNYEIKEPNDVDSIVLFLSSGIFKGIGTKTAKKIVELFGMDTINTIKNDYSKLTSVPGLSLKKAERLHDKIMDNELNQELILKLNSYGLSVKEAIDLISMFKGNIMNIISNNIYDLSEYISFDKLDMIYLKDNEEDTKERIEALIKHDINALCYESGDTMISVEELFVKMKQHFLGRFDTNKFLLHLKNLKDNGYILEINNCLMLNSFYDAETKIYNCVMNLNSIKTVTKKKKVIDLLNQYEKVNNIVFNSEQREAIVGSIINNFYIITGGPGTGKTTIIKAIVDIMIEMEMYRPNEIALLAPTGRSAKRMCESLYYPASTIHKYLGWNKEINSFSVNEYNKSKEKVIIIDESSMIDIFLFSSLFDGVKNNIKLILIGDANQLPSIGPGDILNDLIKMDSINKMILTFIYRVKKGSYISYLADDIKNKKEFILSNDFEDFRFIESSEDNIIPYVSELCKEAVKKGLKPDEFQILAPMYKGINGIDNLNTVVSNIFNPSSERYRIKDLYYKENDKVIQLVNDMDNNVYNGDIGYIKSIGYSNKKLIVEIDFQGNIVEYTSGEFDSFSLAYAISVHKSQGSEYDNVVVILSRSFNRMFYNKLIYTAITRAKKSLIIIGSTESFNKAISTDYASNRKTYLKNV